MASAEVDGQHVVQKAVTLGEIKLAGKPKILVRVRPSDGPQAHGPAATGGSNAVELFIAPGQTMPAIVHVERNGFDGEISFGVEHAGRNLPHGVYVDNIGLNGMTLLQGETQREFFITAARWVPETDRPFHLRAAIEGNQTSWPVMLHVRKPSSEHSKTINIAASGEGN
jgi:hypothetical protein